MTFCLLEAADSATLRDGASANLAARAAERLLAALLDAGLHAVPAGGPYHPLERVAVDLPLGRRLLHAGIAAGADVPVFHVVGDPDASLIDGLVRYLDAMVAPSPPVVIAASAAGGARTLGAALRAREALSARGRTCLLIRISDVDRDWIDTLRAVYAATHGAGAVFKETLPLRRHVHLRWVLEAPDHEGRFLDGGALLRDFGIRCITRGWSTVTEAARRHPDHPTSTEAGRRLLVARSALIEARNEGAGSVTFPRGLADDERVALRSTFASAEDRLPFGLDGDDPGALTSLLVQRAMTPLRPLAFHAEGRRGTAAIPDTPTTTELLMPPTEHDTLARLVRHPSGWTLAVKEREPDEDVGWIANWPSDRAARIPGRHKDALAREAAELGIAVRIY